MARQTPDYQLMYQHAVAFLQELLPEYHQIFMNEIAYDLRDIDSKEHLMRLLQFFDNYLIAGLSIASSVRGIARDLKGSLENRQNVKDIMLSAHGKQKSSLSLSQLPDTAPTEIKTQFDEILNSFNLRQAYSSFKERPGE